MGPGGPNEYSGRKRVRDFEKSVLRDAYRDACEPGNHVPECARTNPHCPHREGEDDARTDGGEELETESGGYQFPERPYPQFRPYHMDLRLEPENVSSDRRHFDRHYACPGSLGRIQPTTVLIGRDGFHEMLESVASEPREIVDDYGGIVASEDANGDYLAWAPAAISSAPDEIDHAMAVATDPLMAAATVRMWYDKQSGAPRRRMTRPNDHYRREQQKNRRYGEDRTPTFSFVSATDDTECRACGSTVPDGGRLWTVGNQSPRHADCTVCARRKARGLKRQGYTPDGPDPREHDIPSDNLITDGGEDVPEDALWVEDFPDIPDEELDRYKSRRELFTCPGCGEVADARVESTGHVGQMLMKPWADIHTEPLGDSEMVYFHVDEDAVDRGRDFRNLIEKHQPEDTEPDPRENPMKDPNAPENPPITDGGVELETDPDWILCEACDHHAFHVRRSEESGLVLKCNVCGAPKWIPDAVGPKPQGAAPAAPLTKARENTEKWGQQDPDALLLAMGEELGELASAIAAYADHADTTPPAELGRDYIRRMADLGGTIRLLLEGTSEDANGSPIPPENRPNYLDAFPEDLNAKQRATVIQSELDDLMALGIQMKWALDAATEGGDTDGE